MGQSLPEVVDSGLVGQAVEQTLPEPVIADTLEEPVAEDLAAEPEPIEEPIEEPIQSLPVEAEIEGTLVEIASGDGNEPAAVIEVKAPVLETEALETEDAINGVTGPAIII